MFFLLWKPSFTEITCLLYCPTPSTGHWTFWHGFHMGCSTLEHLLLWPSYCFCSVHQRFWDHMHLPLVTWTYLVSSYRTCTQLHHPGMWIFMQTPFRTTRWKDHQVDWGELTKCWELTCTHQGSPTLQLSLEPFRHYTLDVPPWRLFSSVMHSLKSDHCLWCMFSGCGGAPCT